MIYDYKCDVCKTVVSENRTVDARDDAPACCGVARRRLIALPRINSNRWCYDDFPTGTSVKDRVEEAKAADKSYEKSWGDHVPSAPPKPPPSLMEVAQEMGW